MTKKGKEFVRISTCFSHYNVQSRCLCNLQNILFDMRFHIQNTLLCIFQYRHQCICQSRYCNNC